MPVGDTAVKISDPRYSHPAKIVRLYGNPTPMPGNRQARLLPRLDRRTRLGRAAHAFRLALIDHVGEPDIVQREVIERCVWLFVRCQLMDFRIAMGEDTEYDAKMYCAWSQSLQRSLLRLGFKENIELMRKKAERDLMRAYNR
jgi:hypothetical protein